MDSHKIASAVSVVQKLLYTLVKIQESGQYCYYCWFFYSDQYDYYRDKVLTNDGRRFKRAARIRNVFTKISFKLVDVTSCHYTILIPSALEDVLP